MNNGVSTFMKGIGAGVVTGVAIAATTTMMLKDNKKVKKKATRAMHTASEVLGNLYTMMR